ncbi:MAG TPA: heavy metal-binding domain-containing protein [Patescibacteria group bacterium]|nr:heavy metal-binding domain-containing protein [Patescibacteria group bacterium]
MKGSSSKKIYTCPMHNMVKSDCKGTCPHCQMALVPASDDGFKKNTGHRTGGTMITKSILYGIVGAGALLGVYFSILTPISGWSFALEQFTQFWYFVVSLAVGFGIQICFYVYLKNAIHKTNSSGKILAVSGATSTGAMISCCAHYLVSILPVVGVAGFVSVVSQYQIELFWVGLAFNIAGIVYIARKVEIFRQSI